MTRLRRFAALSAVMLLSPAASQAHVNSPHIYVERLAGPYSIIAIVHMPPAIPGEADVQIRIQDRKPGETFDVRVLEVPPQGDDAAPEWVQAKSSPVDPDFYSAPAPLMVFGVWRIRIGISGPRGEGSFEIPINASVPAPRSMNAGLSAILILMICILTASLWQISRGLASDAHRSVETLTPRRRRIRGVIAAIAGSSVFFGVVGFHLFAWSLFDRGFQARSAPQIKSDLDVLNGPAISGRKLSFEMDVTNRRGQPLQNVAPDHGKMMHLLVVKVPEASYFLHVHPRMEGAGRFVFSFTPPEPGTYKFFADVLLDSGVGETLTREIRIGEGSGGGGGRDKAFEDPDDSDSSQPPIGGIPTGASSYPVGDGLAMRWVGAGQASIRKGEFVKMEFEITTLGGQPVGGGEPYMGMAGHLLAMRSDASIFAHVHPMGTVSGMMLMSGGGMDHSKMGHAMTGGGVQKAMETVSTAAARATFPYGFPEKGLYRLWVQMRRQGKVYTGVFDVPVG